MRITSIGGGPGGLYAAILLKAADPDREVTVLERNAPDDTFGFGVVFSAATLAELEDADAPSYGTMMRACARWDPVEVLYRGERVRAHGNRFAAISRHRLLDILQERCRELGVDLRFRTEVEDPRDLLDADLLLGADGVNSRTRDRFADTFGPRLTVEGSKFIWLGTTRAFDAFTFIFRETEFGPFQAHIYPYSERMSTFIVECAEDTWRVAGLDRVDPASLPLGVSDLESLKFLQELFADHLDGHELVPNNSKWLDWVTVRNDTWRHRNVVLLGDAAHTAHFSIGSGTKLAMEDAIALAGALARAPDLEAALAHYESVRKPAVERVQEAAGESLDWFARYGRYWGFHPAQFAYTLLTRSERVDYDNLKRRDPDLVAAVDRWFAEESERGGHDVALLVPPPPALTSLRLRGRHLANRTVVVPPAVEDAVDRVPPPAQREAVHRLTRAGAGLVLVEQVAVAADGRVTPADAGLYTDEQAATWQRTLAEARRDGPPTPVGVQLVHAGPRGATRPRSAGIDLPLRRGGWPLVAASPVPYTDVSPRPRALDRVGMDAVREEFVAAARRADAAGFDLLELHAGHGYLLASLLSPLTNRRDDAYGGDLDSRLRFPLEVLDAVREAWPDDKPLSVCFSASDLQPGGVTEEEAVETARRLAEHGADLLHVVAGQTTPAARPSYDGAYDAPWSDLVRNGAGVRTLVGGGIPTRSEANHLLVAGKADLCIIGRPLPAEPPWLARLRAAATGGAG
jgi:anthraniloyl-CoA monooxygenase